MNPNSTPLDNLLTALASDPDKGLDSSSAANRLNEYGKNVLKTKKNKSYFQRFANQFKDIMIITLLVAAAISFAISIKSLDSSGLFEPVLILLIVVLNATAGVVQEGRAEKALAALKTLSSKNARVIRDASQSIIDASLLVPGDIIILEAGDIVPADARLIMASSLRSDESALTGESVPSEKDTAFIPGPDATASDMINMVFSGCSITGGTAKALVTATGMNTEMGKIADLLAGEDDTLTPLQKRLSNLGKYLGIIAIISCIIIFITGLLDGIPLMDIFMISVSLAVSAIPEGLPAIVTVVLSLGVQRMVKQNAIIRHLPAVETLGSASVICSDKTGTLTQNKMTVVSAFTAGSDSLFEIDKNESEELLKLLKFASLCCNSTMVYEGDTVKHIGDPTETAIVASAYDKGIIKNIIEAENPRLAEIPFDSDRKLMTTINKMSDKNIVITKGAYDNLITRCIQREHEFSSDMNDAMTSDALRVIAVAYKEIDSLPDELSSENIENGLIFLGLIGMTDPPRPEVKAAVEVCRNAGIKPVMITGDHLSTASAIAGELGILEKDDLTLTGSQMESLSDEELDSMVADISVYARVSPRDKLRIIKAWQKRGDVVSMTGDGVNDAPALKAADIGCAMGITGTDVAKEASDIILTDDNFATIVEAVREGRGIYENIKKVVIFLIGTNIGEVFSVFIAMVLWRTSPLLSTQLLWINLVTDSFPAIALGMEKTDPEIMKLKPRSPHEGFFTKSSLIRVLLQGLMLAILTLFAFWYGSKTTTSIESGRTMAFLVLALSQISQAFNIRSEKSLFKTGVFSSKNLNIASSISIFLMVIVVFTPLRIFFGLTVLSPFLYAISMLLSLVPIVVMEAAKFAGLIKN
ncbi:calcium-translocating P-type ATPase, PMCA-type [Proteocatella sphenisci]|uniref:calcium-translocating P-type ATPase, PMCA-type n=1 Tax=Proteocatella sphenisci TaxID=181070 RepID=UPI00048DD5DB|nr:calcium-translocating P-type ATPase, PMCA-type [Proteocatella sphenisci]